ncbi:MAG: hypothetical protein QXF82_10690, partial [Nitrososphaeria archaeon]
QYQGKKRNEIVCPYCKTVIKKNYAFKLWTLRHVEILNELRKGVVNKDKILTTHYLIVKQTKKKYYICDEKDALHFLEACKALSISFKNLEKYLPNDEIPCNNQVFAPVREYGIKYWYELFNPRQLIALLTLLEYVNDQCKKMQCQEEMFSIANLYLALGVSKVADYNSIITTWKRGTIRDTIGQYAQGRRIVYDENYCEAIVPYRNLNWIYEPDVVEGEKTEGGIYPILSELCKRLSGLREKIVIMQGDSRRLSSLLSNVSTDVINVDPPYFDQHIYSDISEYFWQILRISLNPLIETGILFKDSLMDWSPMSPDVPREGEVIVRPVERKENMKKCNSLFSKVWYTIQMGKVFKESSKILKNDGVLLTWFTHRSMDAWKAIVCALYTGGFYVTKLWPVTSELLTRLVSKKKDSALNKTLIIVARKSEEKEISEKELKDFSINMMKEICDILLGIGTNKSEFLTFLKAAAICALTRAPPPENEDPIQYFEEKLIPWSTKLVNEMLDYFYERFETNSNTLEKFF